jgi:hypothetical protein
MARDFMRDQAYGAPCYGAGQFILAVNVRYSTKPTAIWFFTTAEARDEWIALHPKLSVTKIGPFGKLEFCPTLAMKHRECG